MRVFVPDMTEEEFLGFVEIVGEENIEWPAGHFGRGYANISDKGMDRIRNHLRIAHNDD